MTTEPINGHGPTLMRYDMRGRDDEMLHFHGKLLGFSTSKRASHNHQMTYDTTGQPLTFAPPKERCSACRWFEVRLFRVRDEVAETTDTLESPRGRYLVVTSGCSIVPGEVEMRRASWSDSPYEVIELLTQRRGRDGDLTPFLPAPSARVLSQAANWDDGINTAYVNRAVV